MKCWIWIVASYIYWNNCYISNFIIRLYLESFCFQTRACAIKLAKLGHYNFLSIIYFLSHQNTLRNLKLVNATLTNLTWNNSSFQYFYINFSDNHITYAYATSTFIFISMSLWTKPNPLKPIIINLPIGKKLSRLRAEIIKCNSLFFFSNKIKTQSPPKPSTAQFYVSCNQFKSGC